MKILIVKMSSLGDIIHTFPVIDTIISHMPQAEIDWVVEKPFAELVKAHPNIRQVLTVQTKKWRSGFLKRENRQELTAFYKTLREKSYDLVLDLQGNSKSGCVTALARSSHKVGFAYATVPEWPNIFTTHQRFNPPRGKNIREDYLFLVQKALNFSAGTFSDKVKFRLTDEQRSQLLPILDTFRQVKGKKVIVCPGSNWTNKQLTKETLQNFLNLFSQEVEVHYFFVWGNQEEKEIVSQIALCLPHNSTVMEKYSLPILQNVMSEADLVIAMDSLPLHLAGTTSTLTYSVFGASSADKYKPIGPTQHSFQGACPYGKQFERRCPILRTCATGSCIKQLDAQALFQHFYEWWKNHPKQ